MGKKLKKSSYGRERRSLECKGLWESQGLAEVRMGDVHRAGES